MALTVDTGQVAANTGSATTTITVTAQGKAIILFVTPGTANTDTTAGNAGWSVGFADGTNLRCIGWAGDNNVSVTNVGKCFRTDSAIDVLTDGTPTSARRVTGVAFTNATTTTLTWDGTPAAAYLIGYIQLGGSDITNVIVGTQTLATSTGAQSVTGLAFKPDFGMFINAQATAAGTAVRALGSIGFAKDSTHEFTQAWGVDDGQNMASTVDAVSYTNAAACMSGITAGAETIDFLADFTSFNSDGYTVNVSNAPTAAWLVGYLLIKGAQWDVGTTTIPTAGGTRTITGMAFQPTALALANGASTADATVTVSCYTSFGAATSTSTEAYEALFHTDNINTTVNRQIGNDKIAGGFPIADNQVDFTAFTSDGWTITAEAGTPNAYQAGWFAVAGNAVVFVPEDDSWQTFPIQQAEPIITVY